MHILRARSTHAGQLERWLGRDQVEYLAATCKDWYGPPIPLVGVPGGVHVRGGGDFVGPIDGGYAGNLAEFLQQRAVGALRRTARRSLRTASMAGFSSLGDLISEATAGGKKRIFTYQKVGVTGVVAATNTLWFEGNQPVAGSAGGAAPGGTAHVNTDAGAFGFTNPTGGDTQHFTRWDGFGSVAANTLLLYDRLFSVAKTMNSTATEAVTGVPTRYQSSTGTNPDYIGGNFLFVECGATALAATAHNWTVCQYVNQSGSGTATLPSLTGNSGNIAKRLDHPTMQWFAPLASGDTGIMKLTQMQCSALVATGTAGFVIGHPLAMLAHPAVNQAWTLDGVTGAFNLNRIFDSACLAFLELVKPATTATTYAGTFETVSG